MTMMTVELNILSCHIGDEDNDVFRKLAPKMPKLIMLSA